MNEIFPIDSISKMHEVFGLPKPKHPLVSVVRYEDTTIQPDYHHVRCSFGMYYVTQKNEVEGTMRYGRNSYDFQEGSVLFIKPGQVLTYDGHESGAEDPGPVFHSDLIRKSVLGRSIDQYSFFWYELTEALPISEDDERSLNVMLH